MAYNSTELITVAATVAWLNTQIADSITRKPVVETDATGQAVTEFHWKDMPQDGIAAKYLGYVISNNLADEKFTVVGHSGNSQVWENELNRSLRITLLFNDPFFQPVLNPPLGV